MVDVQTLKIFLLLGIINLFVLISASLVSQLWDSPVFVVISGASIGAGTLWWMFLVGIIYTLLK